MKDNYGESIQLACPTCGHLDFEYDEKDSNPEQIMTCSECGLELTKNELVESNGERIENEVEKIKEQVIKDAEKEIMKSLSKMFK